ncbi:hypothetical protein GC105_14320 [Alkalibaculum sp. M08DMB]|uniref:Isoprenylcysteine carboxylmethyltransferase family protein n=1 Tax=Alkalibaculum sporogenes TaxID=2655001 RepID=A0A6A7KCR2_9FIRM|nr:isoprenylcysteine carboxylmethyltransferase family protein [Alkalibaculum sporogenes]MPW26957.1 hypothetical protein [Alkalibaculum sporogenes]
MIIFTFDFIIRIIISFCMTALVISIVADFVFYGTEEHVKKSKRSIVATGTMFLFFFVYFGVIKSGLGQYHFLDEQIERVSSILGTIMIILGVITNILGRLKLKANWANHIKIYDSHKLIRTGIYRIVRHPLYASLMLMLFGGVLVYKNYLSFFLTNFVFLPFMDYRVNQEESMLLKEFPEYEEYKRDTGKFFPKFFKRR